MLAPYVSLGSVADVVEQHTAAMISKVMLGSQHAHTALTVLTNTECVQKFTSFKQYSTISPILDGQMALLVAWHPDL